MQRDYLGFTGHGFVDAQVTRDSFISAQLCLRQEAVGAVGGEELVVGALLDEFALRDD